MIFYQITGNVSSISGSESESEDEDSVPPKMPTHTLLTSAMTFDPYSTDSDVELSRTSEEQGRKYPKIFFRNAVGDLISLYRCVVLHKKVCCYGNASFYLLVCFEMHWE